MYKRAVCIVPGSIGSWLFPPWGGGLSECGVRLRAIEGGSILTGRSFVALYEMAGTPRLSVRAWRRPERVPGCDTTGTDETGQFLVRSHPSNPVGSLLEPHGSYATHLDLPVEFVDPSVSTLRIPVIGTKGQLRETVAARQGEGQSDHRAYRRLRSRSRLGFHRADGSLARGAPVAPQMECDDDPQRDL